jgi:uncharacterized protein (TIGR00304 family)
MDAGELQSVGLALTFAGTLIVVVATLLFFLSKGREGKVRGGGAIIIGPVPIVFGTDKKSIKAILLLSIILTALLVTVTIILHFMSK